MKRGDKFATFRRARDLLVDHPNHDKLIRFAGWDAAAFEADGLLLPLSNFHLSLRKVFEREPHWHRPLTPLLASKDVLQQVSRVSTTRVHAAAMTMHNFHPPRTRPDSFYITKY
mmetsp:Transcript_72888/g.207650  ORF Transcript_72888/g.207650 Transcript_72888/m.207650 type:complete len:114 (-) Transcript_72888:137-478(-)